MSGDALADVWALPDGRTVTAETEKFEDFLEYSLNYAHDERVAAGPLSDSYSFWVATETAYAMTLRRYRQSKEHPH